MNLRAAIHRMVTPAPLTLGETVDDILAFCRIRGGRAIYHAEWTVQATGRWLLTVWRRRGDEERYSDSVEGRTGHEAAVIMLHILEASA